MRSSQVIWLVDLRKLGLRLAMVAVILTITNCSFPLYVPEGGHQNQISRVVASIEPKPTSTSTPVVAQNNLASAPREQVITPQPTYASEPLIFTFPTSEGDPVSLWRPPLYPVPWEPSPYDHFYFVRPIGANEINWPLAKYRYGGLLYTNAHTGIDIPAPKGTTVLAAGPGEVIWASYGLGFLNQEYQDPYGIAIAIKHDFGYQGNILYTVYAHLDALYVIRGQRVRTGEVIGLVGETGKVSGPHLHFEVRMGDNRVFSSRNPELWIAPPQGWGVLVGRVMESSGRPLQQQMIELRKKDTNGYWYVHSYAEGPVTSDEFYRENVVLGDVPAGIYTLWTSYQNSRFKKDIEIKPGRVTFFSFWGRDGFDTDALATPDLKFIPPDSTETPTSIP